MTEERIREIVREEIRETVRKEITTYFNSLVEVSAPPPIDSYFTTPIEDIIKETFERR